MTKKIKIIAFSIAILGLMAELLFFERLSPVSRDIFYFFKSVFTVLDLNFLDAYILQFHISSDGYMHSINSINILFYILLLAGAIFYSISEKETRLIRFVVSVLFISQSMFLLYYLIASFIFIENLMQRDYWWIFWIFSNAIKFLYIYAAYFILTNLRKGKTLVSGYDTLRERFRFDKNEATRWQRIYNLLLDTFLCICLFSWLARSFGAGFLMYVEVYAGERFAFFVFYFIISLIYYLFFETIFGATPAKLLTETRVVDLEEKKPKFQTILWRTLARHIPFDALSFLSYDGGWHDRVAKTRVIREERTGVKGILYFVGIVAFVVLYFWFLNEKCD